MKNYVPYRYRIRAVAPPEYDYGQTVLRVGNQEVLTGVVQNLKASDLEERVARALTRLETSYTFRARITSAALGDRELTRQFDNVKGEIEIDFLAEHGQVTPIFVDGQIAHYFTKWQADADKAKTDITNAFGARFGWREAVRIPFWKLIDQDMADRTVRDVFHA